MRPDPERDGRLKWASLSDRGRVRPGNEDFAGDPDTLAALAGPRVSLGTRDEMAHFYQAMEKILPAYTKAHGRPTA